MKKITLSIAALFAVFTLSAQEINKNALVKHSLTEKVASPQGTSAVVLEQAVNVDGDGNAYGFLSGLYDIEGDVAPLLLATSFEITNSTDVGKITIPAFQANNTLSTFLSGLNLYIFPNESNDLPDIQSTGLSLAMELDQVDNSIFQIASGSSGYLEVDVQTYNGGTAINLAPGTYWLCVAPSLTFNDADDFPGQNTGNLWRWFSAVPTNTSQPTNAIFDPAGILLDNPSTNFERDNTLTDLGEPGHLAFIMDDTGGNLAVTNLDSDKFMYYNTNEALVLSSENTIDVASIYDITGKKVFTKNLNTTNANLSIANLQTGVYIAQVQVEGKTKTFKFVKK